MARKLVVAFAFGAALAAPTDAGAAVTFGSDLAPDPVNASSCLVSTEPCTVASTVPGTQNISPVDGVIVRWRVRAKNGITSVTSINLRLLKPLGGSVFLGKSGSSVQQFADSTITIRTYETRLPVAAGDLLGLDVGPFSNNFVVSTAAQPGVTAMRWQPPLAEGATSAPSGTFTDNAERLINADVEPDADKDGFGDETQDKCPGEAGGADGCPTSAPKAKKCKKAKKKGTTGPSPKGAEAAKKKKCKKKRKKK